MYTTFKPAKQNVVVVQRRTDILTVLEVNDFSVKASEISAKAAEQPSVPHYKPDGAGAILVFHTESDNFVLGGVRSNPALAATLTTEDKPYPQQINLTIGGYLANSELPLIDAIIHTIKNKMFLTSDLEEGASGFDAQQTLKKLCAVLESQEGWEEKICVHTDKWINNDTTEGTMCFLTAIKHIQCSNTDLAQINNALQTIMAVKKAEGVNLRTLSEFKFVPLEPVISNSLSTYLEDEVTKAKAAYEKFGNTIAVTFNDLAVATLKKNDAFEMTQGVQLSLDNRSFLKLNK